MTRNSEAKCVNDEKRSCAVLARLKTNLDAVSQRFTNHLKNHKPGNCDPAALQNHMATWVAETNRLTDGTADGNCAENPVLNYEAATSFYLYLMDKQSGQCLDNYFGTSRTYDLTLQKILFQDIL